MANYYWFRSSGTANWTATGGSNSWYTGSGGTGTRYVTTYPTAADNAIFDANSGLGTCSISPGASVSCLNLYCRGLSNNSPTKTTVSAGAGTTINVYGDVVISEDQIFDVKQYPTLAMVGTTPATISCSGNTLGNLTINKGTGSVTLNQDLIGIGNALFDLSTGTFNANNKNVTFGAFQTGYTSTSARTLNMGSGTWTFTFEGEFTNPVYPWSIGDTTGLTFNKDTANIRFIHAANDPVNNNSLTTGMWSTLLPNLPSSIGVVEATSFPTTGVVLIDNELIYYDGVNVALRTLGTNSVTRGYGGTTSVAHAANTAVIYLNTGNSTLTSSVSAGTTTPISVANASLYPTSGNVLIDNENIVYVGTNTTTNQLGTTSITRAFPSADHSAGTRAYLNQIRGIYAGGLTYNKFIFGNLGYISNSYIYGSNTFSDVANGGSGFTYTSTNNTFPGFQKVRFEAGTTNTCTNLTFSGSGSYQQYIGSSSSGDQAILRASTAEEEGVFLVGANSVDLGDNIGLTFASGGNINYINFQDINFIVTNYITSFTGVSATANVGRVVIDTRLWDPIDTAQSPNWAPITT